MPARLLLDEMFPPAMADRLNAKGHDVRAVVADPEFTGLPDEDVLIGATEAGRALVTANVRDFMPIDARYRAASRSHAGLIMVSSKSFPQSRGYVIAVTSALDALLAADGVIQAGAVVFLAQAPRTLGNDSKQQRLAGRERQETPPNDCPRHRPPEITRRGHR